MIASRAGQREVVEVLVDKGTGIDLQFTNGGETARMRASRAGQREVVEVLLRNGASYKAK